MNDQKLYTAKIIADSIGPSGKRLTTLLCRLSKSHQAEFNTHRRFSRNSASSRAVPVEKMIKRILDQPALPVSWGKNQKGMQAEEDVSPQLAVDARVEWLEARNDGIRHAMNLAAMGIHKQITNRLIEPWIITEIVLSTTEVENFRRQRCDKHADPSFQQLAYSICEQLEESKPRELRHGDWHLPFVDEKLDDEFKGAHRMAMISAARCARSSYLNHEGKRDIPGDVALAERLIGPGHWSPFEHPAAALDKPISVGNMDGWMQLRSVVDVHNFTKCVCGHPAEVHGPVFWNEKAKKMFTGGVGSCKACVGDYCRRFS